MPVLAIPKGIDDLTAEWLTGALSGVSDGAEIMDLVAVRIGNGNIADSVRLIPVWDRPTAAPGSVVAKVPSSTEVSRATGFATRTYEVEAAFYNDLAGTVWVNRPACHLARFDADNQAYVVLLEDLAPAEAGDQITGCPVEDAASVMTELAALHAPRWGDPTLFDIPWIDRPTPEGVTNVMAMLPALFAGFTARYRDRVDPEVLDVSKRLFGSLESYLLDRPQPWTVVHGDFRLDNLMFGAPRVAVVDWQTVKLGPALSDVAYFIGSALLPGERRLYEAELVRRYHGLVVDAGAPISWDECWEGYRRYSFDGLIMGIAASMLVTQTPRSDDMFMAMVNRHGLQALDLGSSDFLR
jgi:Phosphotransferase enzyme family